MHIFFYLAVLDHGSCSIIAACHLALIFKPSVEINVFFSSHFTICSHFTSKEDTVIRISGLCSYKLDHTPLPSVHTLSHQLSKQ